MVDLPQEPAAHLEALWAGDFGDSYVERNADAARGRERFWREQLARMGPESVLEVGCNVGGNLRWVAEAVGAQNTTGIDVNERALEALRESVPGVDARKASARELPFPDASFDLVFTMGVLIHQPPESLDPVMSEIVRCSARWVLCGEYFNEEAVEVPYRGETGALFKRDFGADYVRLSPELRLADRGFLARGEDSWDDVTWWLFEKP